MSKRAWRLHGRLLEHGGRGNHRKVLAVAKKLIAVLEREPPSADRDLMLVNALAVRADVLGRQGAFSPAIADGRRAMALLAELPDTDDITIVRVQSSLVQILALADRAEEIRAMDHGAFTAYRSRLPNLSDDAIPPAVSALSPYAAALHMIGDDEEACAVDRELAAAFRSYGGTPGAQAWGFYCAILLNLAKATPSAAESRDVAEEVIERLGGLMNDGHFFVAGQLVDAMIQRGLALRRLDDPETVQHLIDAEFVLESLRLAVPDYDGHAAELATQITPAERDEGRPVSEEVAVMVGDWKRKLDITFRR
ncbi:hypothetical protein [Actinomadura sp. 6N118]|uniref:hypothetical protein n=1 Tax=Actinomadura sp. 6N118 TaxID=3375151 RepID=UPI0037A82FBE